MTKALLLSAMTVLGASAAQAGVSTLDLTCADAYSLVQSHGAIVLRTGEYTYDRFVAHQGYCSNAGDETTRPAWAPTADVAQCFVGYVCTQDNRGGGNGG